MSSMFDGLTVSAPGMGVDTQGAYGYTPQGGAPVIPQASSPASGAPVASIAATGLIAKVEPAEFIKLVTQAAGTIVLYTAQARSAQKVAVDRYVACVGGIVFISHSSSALRFPGTVQVVVTSAVLCGGRPLSSEDYM